MFVFYPYKGCSLNRYFPNFLCCVEAKKIGAQIHDKRQVRKPLYSSLIMLYQYVLYYLDFKNFLVVKPESLFFPDVSLPLIRYPFEGTKPTVEHFLLNRQALEKIA